MLKSRTISQIVKEEDSLVQYDLLMSIRRQAENQLLNTLLQNQLELYNDKIIYKIHNTEQSKRTLIFMCSHNLQRHLVH